MLSPLPLAGEGRVRARRFTVSKASLIRLRHLLPQAGEGKSFGLFFHDGRREKLARFHR